MGLHGGDQIIVHGSRSAPVVPEGPVSAIASRAAGDLADLVREEPPRAPAVELAQAGEGHVIDIHVEAHADGIGGDEKIYLAGLEQGHLGVTGARRERAHDHRRSAPLTADELGDGVDLLGREGDHGAATGKAADLARPGRGQGRVALPKLDPGVGQQAADEWGHGRRAPRSMVS